MPNPFVFDYDRHGGRYASHRRTDPRIAAYVHEALGPAATVLNVGAGAGSYEPTDRYVLAVEPSAAMRSQRPATLPPVLTGTAEALPLDDKSIDAAMAMVTIHHWKDIAQGLHEMQRVARQRVVIMTFDGDALDSTCTVTPIPIPLDCVDGFQEAFYGRPEAFLDPEVRRAQSAWGFFAAPQQEIIVRRLADDLQSGAWDLKYGHLRTQPYFVGALRLITATL